MSEIWGVFDYDGLPVGADESQEEALHSAAILTFMDEHSRSYAVARLYTAAEVRAILHDMPDAAARFEGAK